MAFRRFYRRTFLNRRGHHAGAYALADFTVEPGYTADDDAKRVSARLSIADCGRVVTLDFDADTPAEARNALHKARLLRDILEQSVDALERAVADAGLSGGRKG
ncbi:hypothetical protein [Promicromonospora sukumoe]|uniref:hypothetical protein n=1 Tax=Promicromonospora sukumoe TaxID=88382 RepID=UPI00035E0FD5|nr:hypothetical protein [Promicromonospora sukumoe]